MSVYIFQNWKHRYFSLYKRSALPKCKLLQHEQLPEVSTWCNLKVKKQVHTILSHINEKHMPSKCTILEDWKEITEIGKFGHQNTCSIIIYLQYFFKTCNSFLRSSRLKPLTEKLMFKAAANSDVIEEMAKTPIVNQNGTKLA